LTKICGIFLPRDALQNVVMLYSVCQSVCMSVCLRLTVCLSVCLSVYDVDIAWS